MTKSLSTYWHFLWAGLLNFVQTGAIVPSQRFLVEKMIAPVPRDYRGEIVELGPGSGPLTLRLAARCPDARIVACEVNPTLARVCAENLAAAKLESRVKVVSDCAEHLLSTIAENGAVRPDFIVSGIPLANLAREEALGLVDRVSRALAPGGMYIQFQYTLLDRKTIRARFPRVRTVPAFLNFPPAFVYYAQK
jgi:phospholipid N-methyltransferase